MSTVGGLARLRSDPALLVSGLEVIMSARFDNFLTANPLMATIKLARYKFIARLLAPDDNVLDVGCNDGVSTNFFAQFANKAIGIERDKTVISQARQSFPHLTFYCHDAMKFQSDEQFDTIIMLDFLEHFSRKEGEIILSHYCQFLSPRGQLIIGTPNKLFAQYRSSKAKSEHLHEYNPGELTALMNSIFHRTHFFAMNDEIVHTGNLNLAWFLFALGLMPKGQTKS